MTYSERDTGSIVQRYVVDDRSGADELCMLPGEQFHVSVGSVLGKQPVVTFARAVVKPYEPAGKRSVGSGGGGGPFL